MKIGLSRTSFVAATAFIASSALLASCSKIEPDCLVKTDRQGRTYTGEIDKNGRCSGYGQLSVGDSVIYMGQWSGGKRHGKGITHDSTGCTISGTWRADTILTAMRTDSLGTYTGAFNNQLVAHGYGSFRDEMGNFYKGKWQNGERNGWGFALSPRRHMRVGEWKNDRYLGERLNYTADRIYGIDISRFQHDVGRRRYAIHWDKVRITHLGTISKKNVSGTVDYPISFCYIKSTEGRSLRNKYYRADYAAARKHGIKCGAYHFFSTTSPAAAQASFFIKNTVFNKGDMPPVLDVEPSHKQIARMGGAAAMFRAVRTWMNMVERSCGVKPVLYVSQTFVNRYLPTAPDIKKNYNVWIARYGEYKPDVHLVYWQLCPDGRVSGITPKVDINVFNGYRNEFEDFLEKYCIK